MFTAVEETLCLLTFSHGHTSFCVLGGELSEDPRSSAVGCLWEVWLANVPDIQLFPKQQFHLLLILPLFAWDLPKLFQVPASESPLSQVSSQLGFFAPPPHLQVF